MATETRFLIALPHTYDPLTLRHRLTSMTTDIAGRRHTFMNPQRVRTPEELFPGGDYDYDCYALTSTDHYATPDMDPKEDFEVWFCRSLAGQIQTLLDALAHSQHLTEGEAYIGPAGPTFESRARLVTETLRTEYAATAERLAQLADHD